MGIFKAIAASLHTEAADQWKEYFTCDSIPADLLMVRVTKMNTSGANKGSNDIITDGSVIAVADGQCAIVVSNGKVISVFKETGENIFRSGDTAGVFSGSSAKSFGKELGRRISFGGDAPAIVHRVYYLNTKEIPGNAFGGSVPFRITDQRMGLDMDCKLEVSGLFSFRICDPEKIYKQLIGNVEHVYRVSYLISQMKADVNGTLLSAFKNTLDMSVRPYELGNLIPVIEKAVIESANLKLRELRGIELLSLSFDRFSLTDKDMRFIGEIQRNALLDHLEMAAATLVSAQANAMESAAGNTSAGAVLGLGLLNQLQS